MREYDTTNITLIRQSRKQLVRIIVRLVEKIIKKIYGPNNNQARGTTMKNLWKRQPRKSCQFKGLGDDPYGNFLP